MSKYCPETKQNVTYLACLDCDTKTCKAVFVNLEKEKKDSKPQEAKKVSKVARFV